jgi:hypothetical protein
VNDTLIIHHIFIHGRCAHGPHAAHIHHTLISWQPRIPCNPSGAPCVSCFCHMLIVHEPHSSHIASMHRMLCKCLVVVRGARGQMPSTQRKTPKIQNHQLSQVPDQCVTNMFLIMDSCMILSGLVNVRHGGCAVCVAADLMDGLTFDYDVITICFMCD